MIYPVDGMSEFTYERTGRWTEMLRAYEDKSNKGQIEMYAKLFAVPSRKSLSIRWKCLEIKYSRKLFDESCVDMIAY